jgi:hypothetical protein
MRLSRLLGLITSAVFGFLMGASTFRRHKNSVIRDDAIWSEVASQNKSEHANFRSSIDGVKLAVKHAPSQDEKKHQRTLKRFFGFWVVPLLVITVGSTWAAYNIWKGGFSADGSPPSADGSPPSADGGLLLFIAAPLGNQVEATINANVDQTGYAGYSLLDLTVNFHHAYSGLGWFIAASGQYAPSTDTPLGAYCPDVTTASRVANTITCPDNFLDGSINEKYRFGDHIGSIDGRQIDRITDSLDGYIDANTVIVTGSLQPNQAGDQTPTLSTKITIPIKTPAPTQLGSDKYFAYAPIATIDEGDFGTGSSLGKLSDSANTHAYFANSATRSAVNYLDVTSLDLNVDLSDNPSELSWASPPTVRSDELQWQSNGQGYRASNVYAARSFCY